MTKALHESFDAAAALSESGIILQLPSLFRQNWLFFKQLPSSSQGSRLSSPQKKAKNLETNHSSSVWNKWITCTHVFFILGKIRHSFKVVIHEFEEQKKLEKIFYLHEKVKLAIKKKRQNK